MCKFKVVTKIVILIFLPLVTLSAISDNLDGKAIATRAYHVEDGKDLKAKVSMTIFENKKESKTRSLELFRIDDNQNDRVLIRVCMPQLLKGTTFLAWNNQNKASDLWIYLPSKKMSRRIAESAKYQSFVASDYTYDDLSKISLTENSFRRLPDSGGFFSVEVIPNKTDSFSKKIALVRKDNFIVEKITFYDKQNNPFKIYKTLELKNIQGIWTIAKSSLSDLKNNSETILVLEKIEYNSNLSKSFFNSNNLERACSL
ncbi:MAG: hypothetical protein A2504_17545 [Bdellovibrionales bacterium RIFOXYD12_FULL_39_22]|nr:MAG: hypothetical protein A2385_15245 [Bdellovibrionales bacterium RIFOXYB1_FULL_39_21]OFZ40636.1 MAG: hypothetical protein A2485_03520 [Bdellovibrionales bacterium RIFOXYC12_FULL_39_17]OFZ50416.1 MAG: hypothetical protein A2404_02545 [Bdellovibrionales bacterium RIFOXYC1_FULL_39_130]OFZ71765.1 MAG: hypothetical protein A2451_08340 [Bdellovibrionales bacterium RIFOXYC2_FULL_39_8]OFZ77675.1 MAG: hypothetical protein A2560_04915 [Bdellovibrionales bacterium RIFOXYD1_FULL_39_84]OFZ91709.1 MAG: